jgi:hypothetical protein
VPLKAIKSHSLLTPYISIPSQVFRLAPNPLFQVLMRDMIANMQESAGQLCQYDFLPSLHSLSALPSQSLLQRNRVMRESADKDRINARGGGDWAGMHLDPIAFSMQKNQFGDVMRKASQTNHSDAESD